MKSSSEGLRLVPWFFLIFGSMTIESVQLVIGKAVLDADFRQLLLKDPERALADFRLTNAEKQSLMKVDGETLEIMANAFEISQSVYLRYQLTHRNTTP